MENFHKGPDVSEAAKVGEPTLVDPKQASAPDMVRSANASVTGILKARVAVIRFRSSSVHDGAAPAENAPVPHSDRLPGSTSAAGDPAARQRPRRATHLPAVI